MHGLVPRIAALLTGAVAAAVIGVQNVVPSPDALAALSWGNVLAEGVKPDLSDPALPLPHPLTIIVGAALSLGGLAFSLDAVAALAGVSWAALIYAAARLTIAIARAGGATRAGVAVAGALAIVIAVRPSTVYLAGGAIVDVPNAALIVFAAALVAERPDRRPHVPLLLLGAAGLIRPEAWVLGGLYALWRVSAGIPSGQAKAAIALALLPAALWISFDWVLSGDPLNTLNEAGGEERPADGPQFNPIGDGEASAAPRWLRGWGGWLDDGLFGMPGLIGTVLTGLGLAGAAWALLSLRSKSRPRIPALIPSALVAATGAALLAESAVGVTVEDRYALPAAVALASLGAGWLAVVGARGLAVPAVLVVIGSAWAEAPKQLKTDRGLLRSYELNEVQLDALREILDVAIVKSAIAECPEVIVGGRGRPLVVQGQLLIALDLDRDATRLELTRAPRAKVGQSVFRLRMSRGPLPRVISRRWEFRSKCLPGGRDRPRSPAEAGP